MLLRSTATRQVYSKSSLLLRADRPAIGPKRRHGCWGWTLPQGIANPHIYLQSGGETGWTYTDSGLLSGIQVDNQHKRYWLKWRINTPYMSGNYVLPSGMVVEISDYNTLIFLPLVRK